MNDLSIFSFESHQIRTVVDDNGEPLFVAKDVAEALGYSNHNDAINRHCKGVVERYPLQTPGGMQDLRVIREPDLYRLIFGSTLESAQAFERLVVEEILPSIRKTGSYTAPTAPSKPVLGAPASDFRSIFGVMRLLGLDRNAAGISANQAVIATHGTNLLLLSGQTHLVAEDQHRYYTPTELGKRIGVSGRRFNLLLADIGMQAREGEHWAPTAAAEGFYRIFDTGKKHSTGTPVTQIKWADAVLPLVRPEVLDADESAYGPPTL